MTTQDFVWMWVAIVGLCFIFTVIGYSMGHKDGEREGYTRGRSISRHVAAKKVSQ